MGPDALSLTVIELNREKQRLFLTHIYIYLPPGNPVSRASVRASAHSSSKATAPAGFDHSESGKFQVMAYLGLFTIWKFKIKCKIE